MIAPVAGNISWERMVDAVQKVEDRLLRSTAALDAAKIPYAVIGGNAIAAWVSSIDPGAVRNTKDVDLLVRRADLPSVVKAMETAGFTYAKTFGVDAFIDGPAGRPSEGVHLLFEGEKVKESDQVATPALSESVRAPRFQVISLEAIVRMKLTSFRLKDQTHLVDLMQLGLIDRSWLTKVPLELAPRLQGLLDHPNP
ncbi:MAG: hypothetical protein ACR2FY_03765 [Pirellulaceae bacterium]